MSKRKFLPTPPGSDEYDADTGVCSIEYFMHQKDPYRVAPFGNSVVLWPIDRKLASSQAAAIAEDITQNCRDILQEFGLTFAGLRCYAFSKKGSASYTDTLVVSVSDVDTAKYSNAATKIHQVLQEHIFKNEINIKMAVELRNDSLMYSDLSYAIKHDSPEHHACLDVEKAVRYKVDRVCPGLWNSISYRLRAPKWESENDRKLTLIITVPPRTKSIWEYVEGEISNAVKDANKSKTIRFYVEILSGEPDYLVSKESLPAPAKIVDDYTDTPLNGASIGPLVEGEAGSLGTWLNFQPQDSNQRILVFLTAYHVIAKGERNENNRLFNDTNGIALEGREMLEKIIVTSPATYDGAHTIDILRAEIKKGGDVDGSQASLIAQLDEALNGNGFGYVMYASGIGKNPRGGKMDWALVRPFGLHNPTNKQPGLFDRTNFPGYKVGAWGNIEAITRVAEGCQDEWVAKEGRTTLATVGEISAMRDAVSLEGGQESSEVSIVNKDGLNFADRGDSGSMVVNLKKEWVGMVWGADLTRDGAYMTPARVIIDDVKAKTGGTITLI